MSSLKSESSSFPTLLNNKYKILHKIGSGSFSQVYLGKWIFFSFLHALGLDIETNNYVAIKTVFLLGYSKSLHT